MLHPRILTATALLAAAGMAHGQSFFESFDEVSLLPMRDWHAQNNSVPGTTGWFQGDQFPPYTSTGYLAANFRNTAGANTISNWMLLPTRLLMNGDTLTFWTRTAGSPVSPPVFPDRLQVRMSTQGASTNVGSAPEDVGDFTTLLLDINPEYSVTGYPNTWTPFTVTLSGLPPAGVPGRLAFRYFVEDGGPNGTRSDYIGIDEVVYTGAAPAGACCLPDGTCVSTSGAACAALGGAYHGDGSACGTVNCPQPPTGACCLPDGTCVQRPEPACTADGGIFRGPGTSCSAGACPTLYRAANLNVEIPDGAGNGTPGADATAMIEVTEPGTVEDLDVDFVIEHPWQGDLRVRLIGPGGQSVTLVHRPGVAPPKEGASINYGFGEAGYGSASGVPFIADDQAQRGVYDDATGAPGVGEAAPIAGVGGRWTPVQPLSIFNGAPAQGVWTLVVNDFTAQDTGAIRQFSLHIRAAGPACYANCDGSTSAPVLNINDFVCFQAAFAAGDPYANCDGSTSAPVLNINDFICFQAAFAAGCSAP